LFDEVWGTRGAVLTKDSRNEGQSSAAGACGGRRCRKEAHVGATAKGNKPTILAVDLGGTNIRFRTFDIDTPLDKPPHKPPESVRSPETLRDLKDMIQKQIGLVGSVVGVAICVPGPVEKDHHKVIMAPSLSWLDGRDLSKELATDGLEGAKVVVSNDMEAAARGEQAYGALQELDCAIFDTISTGWGGVLILDKKIFEGEPGHVNTSFDSPFVCGCGNVGCNEARYSGAAMERQILSHLEGERILFPRDFPSSRLWAYFDKELETGAEWATLLLEGWAEGVGRAWANVLNRVRPIQGIVYMGPTAEELIPHRAEPLIRSTLKRICMFPEHASGKFQILRATCKDRSLVGATLIYQERTGTPP
jgi:glucokinase